MRHWQTPTPSATPVQTPTATSPSRPSDSPEAGNVRNEVRAWLESNWDPNQRLVSWRNKLADSGWGMPTWPAEWFGRDLPQALAPIVDDEFTRIGAVGAAKTGIRILAGATLLEHGNDDQKCRFLRRILTGEDTWCQLFKRTRQRFRPGGRHHARRLRRRAMDRQRPEGVDHQRPSRGLRPTPRTDGLGRPEAPGAHLFHPRHAPGRRRRAPVETDERPRVVQPGVLHRCGDPAGESRLRHRQWLGGRHHHPRTRTTERRWPARSGPGVRFRRLDLRRGTPRGRDCDGTLQVVSPARRPRRPGGRARQRNGSNNRIPPIRQEIAKPCWSMARSAEWTARRARAAQEQGPTARTRRVRWASSRPATSPARPATCTRSSPDPMPCSPVPTRALDGLIAEILISVPAVSIAGGTDEIQRNIIAERVLGLPKEPRMDRGPFRDVRRN